MSFFRTKDFQYEVDPRSLGKEGQELDLCMRIQNYLFGITEVGQESSFEWSPAEGMNSSPLEKEVALAAAAEGTCQEGFVPQHAWGTGEERAQHWGGGSSRDVAGGLAYARASHVANALRM